MHADKLNMWDSLGGMWKTPVLSLKRFPPLPTSPQKNVCATFWGPLYLSSSCFGSKLKTSGLDWMHSKILLYTAWCIAIYSATNQKKKKNRRRCRKLQIRNHYAATNMTGTVLHIIWAPTITHSVSLPMSVNNASRVCIVLQSRRLFLWIGGKLQKRPLQIRHDGFIIRLKCQLLQKPIPRLHSADRSFELPIIPAKPKQSPFCKTLAPTLRNTHDQCWLSCWQQRVTGLIYAFITRFIQGTQRPYLIAKKGLSLSLSFLNCCFLI